MRRTLLPLLPLLILAPITLAADSNESSTSPARQYTFSWNFIDGSQLAPRGGTTKGPAVSLVKEPTAEFKRLQEPGLSSFERDRRAILAMAGGYRSSFDFLEVAGFTKDFKPDRPYQSWATEKVYVIEDKGKFISLQHLLVMTIVNKDGKAQGPFVTKHWRQDWQYEPSEQFLYRGYNAWTREPVPVEKRRTAWRQSVYQVDDSPRYAGTGRWHHFGNYSSWESEEGWRPLPRREFSVRSDYHVLAGTNRHIILPTGWVHEQQNLKLVLDDEGKPRASEPVLARELGYNRYDRIEDIDWSAGDHYIERTEPLWKAVRTQWAALIARDEPLRLRGAPDKDQLFGPLFDQAEKLTDGTSMTPQEISTFAKNAVRDYLRLPGEPTGNTKY